jgi:hypothetical protein
MNKIDVAQILSYGVIGLGFLLALLAFWLLTREQKKRKPDSNILRATYVFMAFSVALCAIGGVAELSKDRPAPTVAPPEPSPSVESYVLLSGNDEDDRKIFAESIILSRRGSVLSGKGNDLDNDKKSWNYAGYINGGYLVLAYRSIDPEGIGFGNYFMEQAASAGNLYMGYWNGNSCGNSDGIPKRSIVQCNAVLVRGKPGGTEELRARTAYQTYLGAGSCKIIKSADLVPAEKCKSTVAKPN